MQKDDALQFVGSLNGAPTRVEADEVFERMDSRLAADVAIRGARKDGGRKTSPLWIIVKRKMAETDALMRKLGRNVSSKVAVELARDAKAHRTALEGFIGGLAYAAQQKK